MPSPAWWKLLAAAGSALALAAGTAVSAAATSAKTGHRHTRAHRTSPRIGPRHLVRIEILSTRADLVSGGEALTQIILPPGAKPSRVKVTLGSRNVTGEFAVRSNHEFEGLLTGLSNGANLLTARLPDG